MIKCLYCGYECPDTASICPNCGKPIIRVGSDKQPTFDDIKEAHLQEKSEITLEKAHSQKQMIIAACAALLFALFIYKLL